MLYIGKIEKAIKNLNNALKNIENEDIRIAIGDLDFAKENAQEAIYLIINELRDGSQGDDEL